MEFGVNRGGKTKRTTQSAESVNSDDSFESSEITNSTP